MGLRVQGACETLEHAMALHCQKHPFRIKGKLNGALFQTDIYVSYSMVKVNN